MAGQAALFNYSTSKMIQRLGLESENPNHVLILTIYNAQYPINVEVIHQVIFILSILIQVFIVDIHVLTLFIYLCTIMIILVKNWSKLKYFSKICEPHGTVKRIAILRRTMLQALVEFENAEIAKKAKHAMNGADIYSGCCTLKVEFAKVWVFNFQFFNAFYLWKLFSVLFFLKIILLSSVRQFIFSLIMLK